jgi:DMSO reductase family type II enzyme molybdopterin subunit
MFALSLGTLRPDQLKQSEAQKAGARAAQKTYTDWQDLYRERWKWDKVSWGTHCVDCYPGNCPFYVFVKDGVVLREEQAGVHSVIEPGVPDRNPLGCQKGAAWSQLLYAKERVLYPLKRAGERGEGKWKRVSWDEALTEIADAILDAVEEVGPESIIHESTPSQGGLMGGLMAGRLMDIIGGLTTDVQANINDFAPGLYLTFGKFDPASSVDDWFHAELSLIWHRNPVYTAIPFYHFIAESRYRGGEVVTIAPDFSPSAIHADYYVPVRPGSDAALALGMCKVIIDEGLYDATFVREQTDLALLVRSDNQHFLCGPDVQEGGREDQFYFFDEKSGQVVEAPRGTLALGDVEPALEGTYSARLADGPEVEVSPVFELLSRRLKDYEPEKASQMCGTHPEIIRTLARKVARMKTNIQMGWNSGKYYHGDLMERAMCLLVALTANWGKKGTGVRCWSFMGDASFIVSSKMQAGAEETRNVVAMRNALIEAIKAEDPTRTEELAAVEMAARMFAGQGMVPPAFFWYYHCGYRERWNRSEWNDPSMTRSFDDYMKEALDKGWWEGNARPGADTPPRVFIEIGGNFLRRERGGQELLLKGLWPKLKMIVSVDWRLNTTGLHSDIFLPVAHHYEKVTFHIPTPHMLQFTLSDQATAPPGEAKPEWEIYVLLSKKLEERARARDFPEYSLRGIPRDLKNAHSIFTANGAFETPEAAAREMVTDNVVVGMLPEGTTLDTLREKGFERIIDWGMSAYALGQASELKLDETHNPFRLHVEKKTPYATLTRRAQFYIDHDWFLEADEALPVHKDTPPQGGDYPFVLTSGHPRWSIHSMNITNRIIQATHRGKPHMVMNPDDAGQRGIEDDEEVRLFNDVASITVPVKLSPSVMPGQVIMYNGWEPYQFRNWRDAANIEPALVKWLHLAGGYGHLRYWPIQWQPVPIDRAIRVDVAKLDGAHP